MLLTVAEFRDRVRADLGDLVSDLTRTTGRAVGANEQRAWKASLPRFAVALSSQQLQSLHLYFQGAGSLSLEYPLPAASYWCDAVILGRNQGRPCAVIVEMKDWDTRGDRPGRAEGLVERDGAQWLHPSEQVRGYTEYCKRFHSAIDAHAADVAGCVLLTRDYVTEPYVLEPNRVLTIQYPVFTMAANDVQKRLPEFLVARIVDPDDQFARDFERGTYRQDRGFLAQIGKQILDPKSSYFELLDDQRRAFALCRATAEEVVKKYEEGAVRKKLIIVKGPPGSGKSAVAARLWATLVTDERLPEGNVVFTTTSSSQNSNWAELFSKVAGLPVGRGIVRGANGYYPITTHKLGVLRKKHGDMFLADPLKWRENLRSLTSLGEKFQDGASDNHNLVTIVDEAHALINPERPEGRGQFGFAPTLGPQAYQIIRCSILTLMFIDPEQGFRDRENTSLDELRAWAQELNVGEVVELDLSGAQFRCGGSPEYVEWIESLLRGEPASRNSARAGSWRVEIEEGGSVVSIHRAAQPAATYRVQDSDSVAAANAPRFRTPFEFHVVGDPEEMEAALRRHHAARKGVRLVSSFSRKWVTRDKANPHALPAELRDFNERYAVQGEQRTWSRIWNYAPGSDYTLFIQASEGSKMANDPLCEVGCPYVVRGFDYDYLGVLWLNDLVWREGHWKLNLDAVQETGVAQLLARARKERQSGGAGPATLEVRRKTAQAYRILLTRALRGVYVWIPDPETREHLLSSLGASGLDARARSPL